MSENNHWKHLFPRPIPRDGQIFAINETIDFFESNLFKQQFVFIDAPTGVGKSAIGITIAKYFYEKYKFGSNYLVHNKFLEQQIINDYTGLAHTLGRGNFVCKLDPTVMCDAGQCMKKGEINDDNYRPNRCGPEEKIIECREMVNMTPAQIQEYYQKFQAEFTNNNEVCSYWESKLAAIHSPIALHNYYYYNLESRFSGDFKRRYIMICDEGHKIEDVVMQLVSFDLSQKNIDKFGLPITLEPKTPKQWVHDIKTCVEYLNSRDFLVIFMDRTNTSGAAREKLLNAAQQLELQLKNIEMFDEKKWIIDYIRHDPKLPQSIVVNVVFKPILVRDYAYDMIFKLGMKVIIMSATMLSKDRMITSLGLDEFDKHDQVLYLSLDCPFPLEQRPIYFHPMVQMNYANYQQNVKDLLPALRLILEKHQGQKGVIHTHSYQLSNDIQQGLKSSRILTHTGMSKDRVINMFLTENIPYVLVSPSVEEGVDLFDDRCRFIVIIKLPFLNLGDQQIKKHLELDKNWYDWKTIQSLIQMVGRGVRHDQDWCTTYILDMNLTRLLHTRDEYFPKWFRNSIIQVNNDQFINNMMDTPEIIPLNKK